jgi:CheY-like chemotaxis protein/GGDEF domain-containing protein
MDSDVGSGLAGRAAFTARASASYVLVADADSHRIEICVDAVKSHGLGVLVARRGEEAIGVLRDFGAPRLLVVDLLLPQQTGLSVIETVRRLDLECGGILAWSSARDLREFAACRLAGINARVLAGSVSPLIIRSAIERVLGGGAAPIVDLTASQSSSDEAIQETMAALAERARTIAGTAGVAVYLRAGSDERFQSATWLPNEAVPRSIDYLPTAFRRIMETREPLLALDLASDRSTAEARTGIDGLHGLVAVPITEAGNDEVVGMICVFDVSALTLGSPEIEALKALGRRSGTPDRPTGAIANRPAAHQRPRLLPDPHDQNGFGSPSVGRPAALLDRQVGALAFTREMARARRTENHLSVVVFDVGPADAGGKERSESADDPVGSVGQTLTQIIRGYDLAIRWSRQELLVVLPGVDEIHAARVAERVRCALHRGIGTNVGFAGGVAELADDHTLESIVVRANENLQTQRLNTRP